MKSEYGDFGDDQSVRNHLTDIYEDIRTCMENIEISEFNRSLTLHVYSPGDHFMCTVLA